MAIGTRLAASVIQMEASAAAILTPFMRLLLQRVLSASVSAEHHIIGQIGRGYLLLLCAMEGDTEVQAQWLAEKVTRLRLFDGTDGKINDRSLIEIGGEVLIVSQFTLAGATEKGNRPDYTGAAKPDVAEKLYDFFIEHMRKLGVVRVETGKFGAEMQVELINDGPVTLLLERSRNPKIQDPRTKN